MSQLPRSTPEAEGIASAAVSAFVSAAHEEIDTLHSFMLLRHGSVIAEGWWEPYRPDEPHVLFSLSKSFTSTAIGLLVGEGRLSVDDPVLKFFPDEAPAKPSARLKRLRVRHLLSMSVGQSSEPNIREYSTDPPTWAGRFLAHPIKHEPGTQFFYNSLATYMLSAIAQQVTGESLRDYLQPRLFAPLGIETPEWEVSPQLINTGGWGLFLTTEQIAKFGQLYLQRGAWQGKQIVPEAWIVEATTKQVSNGSNPESDWEQGYCYQFWRCRHNAYRGDGAFGQFCVVLPDHDVVIAITSGVGDMQAVLNLIWKHLLPAFQTAPLPADPTARAALDAQFKTLRLRTPTGAATSPLISQINGRTYTLSKNRDGIKALRFDFDRANAAITLRTEHGEQRLTCGFDQWVRGAAVFHPHDGSMYVRRVFLKPGAWALAAAGAWTDEMTYTARVWWVETSFSRTMTFRFAENGSRVTVEQRGNVGFEPTEWVTLRGRRQAKA